MSKMNFEKKADKEFTVLNLTDTQLSNGEWAEGHKNRAILEHTVRELIKKTNPDLITVSGDLAWAGHDHAYDMLAEFLDSFHIPWAPVWGNHDNQNGEDYIKAVAERYKSHPMCVYEDGPSEMGNGNYVIRITEADKTVFALIMMDTHDRAPYTNEAGENENAWGKLRPSQVQWIEQIGKQLKEEGCLDVALVQHIPIHGYRLASSAAYKEGIDHKALTVADSMSSTCWNSGYEDSVGVQHEGVASYPADEGALEALKRTGIVKSVIAGHDHINNWIIRYDGITMVYALKTGAGCYWDPTLNGGTIMKIGKEGVTSIYHEYVDISEILKEFKMKRVYDFLKKAEVYYLATVEGDQPRVRPFGTILQFEGKLYIQTGKIKPTSRQLAANAKAEICAFCEGAWVRIACELIEDDRVEARKAMLDAYPNLRSMYDENDGNTQVLYMQNATATFSAFGKESEVVEF